MKLRRLRQGITQRIRYGLARLPCAFGGERLSFSARERMAPTNGLGEDGLELVTFYVNGAGDNVFVLKRPKGE